MINNQTKFFLAFIGVLLLIIGAGIGYFLGQGNTFEPKADMTIILPTATPGPERLETFTDQIGWLYNLDVAQAGDLIRVVEDPFEPVKIGDYMPTTKIQILEKGLVDFEYWYKVRVAEDGIVGWVKEDFVVLEDFDNLETRSTVEEVYCLQVKPIVDDCTPGFIVRKVARGESVKVVATYQTGNSFTHFQIYIPETGDFGWYYGRLKSK